MIVARVSFVINNCRDTDRKKDKEHVLCNSTSMSSINDSGENEFAYEESNVVGKSENSPEEEDKKILKSLKEEILEEENNKE
ncbi:hypothetical protein [Candidatus Nitrosocosmicus hydrocola]|uniref:hypothetical protein n=1 Tax=Candidatus Nitrosocosmicus hydrocola TaxID=1826872 RepID=UPI0013732899|nr:hypothetical protein [Candidatus Nitrosocosmicus hydrocola]